MDSQSRRGTPEVRGGVCLHNMDSLDAAHPGCARGGSSLHRSRMTYHVWRKPGNCPGSSLRRGLTPCRVTAEQSMIRLAVNANFCGSERNTQSKREKETPYPEEGCCLFSRFVLDTYPLPLAGLYRERVVRSLVLE